MSMLWFTSLSGACVTTKQNLVAKAIAFSFLLLRSDARKPHNLTSEPAEHEFGNYRTKKDREFPPLLGVCNLAENNACRSRMMFLSNLIPTCDAQKGYQATHSDRVAYNKICTLLLEGGPVPISADGCSVAAQLWSTVSAVIATASNLMKPFLLFLGVTDEEISPFCHNLTSLDDLCDAFIAYCPSTFSYEGSVGIGKKDNDAEMNSDDGIMPKAIVNMMRGLVNDLLGPDGTDNLDASATEDNSGTGNAATATTNEAQPMQMQGEINNAKIVHAVESLLTCADMAHLSKLALDTSSFLDTNGQGSTRSERKVKSLRSRWICSSGSKNTRDTNSSKEGMWIERGTILTLGVTLGRGTAATIVTHKYPVIAVFEKSYNKWFMTGEKRNGHRRWQKRKRRSIELKLGCSKKML
eukprot:scaffold10357_cov66-Attheya_sp.AAC.7